MSASDQRPETTAAFDALQSALQARKSTRGFQPQPIEPERLQALFALAQRAPSWCNVQPWRVVVTSGTATVRLREAVLKAAKSGLPTPDSPFPLEYPEPYLGHRRASGHALYGAMGIERGDKSKRYDAWLRNYQLFDAPHCAIVCRDRRLGEYATLDIGVWLGTLLAGAATLGIETCPMAALAGYPQPLRELLDIPDEHVILLGIALGTGDPEVLANSCRTTREPLAANVRFVD